MMSWLVGQAAWAWAKAGIWDAEYTEAFAYPNEDENTPEDYQESEKSPVDAKSEKLFTQEILINRTRPEACDQEVKRVTTVTDEQWRTVSRNIGCQETNGTHPQL